MRKVLFFALILLSAVSFSQAPQYLNYQAIARNGAGTIVTTPIGVKFEILQGSSLGTVVYEETHNITPSSAGIFTAAIGNGSIVMGNFPTINWANSPYFIRVSIDPAGGTSYSTVGTSQLLSVPYALFAEKAGNSQTLTAGNGITINSGTITNSAPNTTLVPSGIASITGSHPSYTVGVPAPSLNYNSGTQELTLTQGTVVTTATITTSSSSVSITGSGVTGSYPNYTITPTPPTTITPGNSNISVTGADPNFTISSVPTLSLTGAQLSISNGNTVTLPTGTTYTNGAGIGLTSGTIITNSAPDQVVSIANGTNVTVNSAYPNFTINATPTLSLSTNVLSISGGNAVTLPSSPATTVSAGLNMVVSGTAPTYTVTTPNYSLNFSTSTTGTLTNGMSVTSVSLPQPTLTLSGVNSNIISAGSNSITIPHYFAGNGLLLSGTSPNFTLGATSTGTSAPWSTLGNTATNPSVNFLGTTDAQDLVFRTGNSQRMRLFNATGNLGVGNVTTASELLQVETGSNTAMSIISGTNSTLYFGNAGNHFLGAVRYDNVNSTMSFWTNNTANRIFIDPNGRVAIGNNFTVSELDVNGSLRLATSRLFLGGVGGVNSGYTGIYENSGDLKLAVFQTGAPANPPFASGGNSIDAITIKNNTGYVGIGIGTPTELLHVHNGSALIETNPGQNSILLNQGSVVANELSGGTPRFVSAINSTWIWGAGITNTGNNDYHIANYSFGRFDLSILNSNGNVGIGTGTPSSKLHVAGAVTIVDGTQGAGKILTSNTSGTGSWKTNQIAFFCGGNPSNTTLAYTASQTATLVFNSGASTLNLNVGGGYSAATGMFTAPVAGVYQFDAVCVFAGATNGYCQLKLRHSSGNLIAEQEGFYNTIGQNWWSGNLGGTVHLNAGERVYVEYYAGSAGGATFYQDKSSFSGHLVYAD